MGKIKNEIRKISFVIACLTMIISALATETYLWKAVIVFAIAAVYAFTFIFVNQGRWEDVL